MGTDIHGWIEKKIDGKYLAIQPLSVTNRNYERFEKLACVRGPNGLDPLGIPDDLSETVQYHVNCCGDDAHSFSYMSLKKAAKIFIKTGNYKYKQIYPLDYFEISIDYSAEDANDSDFRLVFWFDD